MKMGFFPFSKSLPLFLVAFVIATCTCHTSRQLLSVQHQQCVYQHFSALLEFQSNMSFWNPGNRDCCTWKGIKCDKATGHVTSVYLGLLSVSGKINFESLCRIRTLQILNLFSNQFFPSPIPSAIGELTSLTHLNLSGSKFYGQIPLEMSSLTRLVSLVLSFNGYYDDDSNFVPLKSESIGALIHNLSSLRELHLDSVDMSADGSQWSEVISSTLPNLRMLSLYNCSLSGSIHLPWVANLTKLTYLDLADNDLSGIIPSSLFALPSLQSLLLWGNQLGGQLSEFHNSSSSLLEAIILGENQLQGIIPWSIFQLRKLKFLGLGYNNFRGVLHPHMFKNLTNLIYLNLSNNTLEGYLPILSPSIIAFMVSSNHLRGEIPISICSASSLNTFDISGNNFSGHIPECFGKMSNTLVKEVCSLKRLDLSDNWLEGRLPSSLANCKHLTILNLGNNQLQDTFPSWIHGLAYLRFFILRSNNFYGPIQPPPTCQNFSELQIVDISLNNLSGSLPPTMFCGWKKMTGKDKSGPGYLRTRIENTFYYSIYYFEQVTIRSKRSEMNLRRISTAVTVVDLSRNHFQGQIPESIGTLKSLWILNMSHNGFTGQIPSSFKNLTTLESLDLSQNEISGNVPPELLELTFLSVLNLSENQLTGSIPHAKQFLTFTNESFQGNPGLCGPPLSEVCADTNDAPSSTCKDAEIFSESLYNWKIMAIGFGIGYGVGVGVFCWTLVLWTKGRIAYNRFVHRMLLLILPSVM